MEYQNYAINEKLENVMIETNQLNIDISRICLMKWIILYEETKEYINKE